MFKNALFFLVVCLGLCGTGFAQENVDSKGIESRTPLLTKEQIINKFDAGVASGATHMLIVWDTYDVDDSYDFVIYSFPGEDVQDLIRHYDAPGFYRVSAVLAMHLDLNDQLSGKRWYPEYP